MLTRALFVFALICGLAPAAWAQDVKVLALGLADHVVSEEELGRGEAPTVPRFNTPGIAYALVEGLKKDDVVEVALVKDGDSLMHNAETLAEDRARLFLQAGKGAVPAGGWPEGAYHASVKVMRDGTTLIEQTSTPIPFD